MLGRVGIKSFHGLMIIGETNAKVKLAYERLKTTQSRQKSYADNPHRVLEIQVRDMVLLRVSPIKGTIRFEQKGKLSPRAKWQVVTSLHWTI